MICRLVAVAGVLFLLATAGCMVGPDYRRPNISLPANFNAQPATQPSTQPAMAVDLERWWESFGDPALNKLIQQAVVSNLDVRLAQARVREARAQLEFNRAALFPTVDSAASFTRSRSSKNAFAFGAGRSGSGTGTGTTGGTTTGTGGTGGTGTTAGGAAPAFTLGTTNLYRAGFDAGWEIDVFGGTRRAIEAAEDTLQAQVEARRNAMVTLLAEVAQNYLLVRGYLHELAIVQRNVAAQQDTVRIQRLKLEAGIATQLTVAQAEALVASTRAQVPTLQTQLEQAIQRLAVLLDRAPQELESQLLQPAPLPAGPPSVPPGLPSNLVRRRPDVRQAERQLAAATANIGVATADLFPKFSLTGSLGLESLQLKNLADSRSVFSSFGPTVSWRIFDANQIWANVHVQNARQEEALIQYRQAIIQSLSDVDVALAAYDHEQARRQSLREAVEANRRSVDLARQLYAAGVVDFLNVLTAQQSLYQSEDQLAQSEQTVATNLIALYKALGGGWEGVEADADRRAAAH